MLSSMQKWKTKFGPKNFVENKNKLRKELKNVGIVLFSNLYRFSFYFTGAFLSQFLVEHILLYYENEMFAQGAYRFALQQVQKLQ
jgi:hypothetical protein